MLIIHIQIYTICVCLPIVVAKYLEKYIQFMYKKIKKINKKHLYKAFLISLFLLNFFCVCMYMLSVSVDFYILFFLLLFCFLLFLIIVQFLKAIYVLVFWFCSCFQKIRIFFIKSKNVFFSFCCLSINIFYFY